MGRRSSTGARSSNGRGARLDRRFFDRPTVRVARELLGAYLEVRDGSRRRGVRIVETEAYLRGDPASHAFRGPTRRNRSMFFGPGTLYVYRIHQVVCANLVTRPGTAVLLRAGEPVGIPIPNSSGPGRLCRALGISLADDGRNLLRDRRIRLWRRVERPGRIRTGVRIGIRRAAERPLRFWIDGNRWVSRPRGPPTSASPTRSRGGGATRRSRTTRRRPSGGGTSGGRSGGR